MSRKKNRIKLYSKNIKRAIKELTFIVSSIIGLLKIVQELLSTIAELF